VARAVRTCDGRNQQRQRLDVRSTRNVSHGPDVRGDLNGCRRRWKSCTGIGEASAAAASLRLERIDVESQRRQHLGADFAIPIAPTVSFVGTLHPDYSNVEIDQQTISPSAFARQYQEIRPFFTQAASYFNEHLACLNCPQTLYTPAIPTFGQGYAVEGTHGYASFAAFDTIGDNRNDAAQSLNYNFENTNEAFGVNLQHVAVSAYGQSDVTTTVDLGYQDNQTHTFSYLNMGQDRGSLVTDASLGNYLETGFGYGDATSTYGVSLQQIGAQFDPLDGFVPQPDIYGYESVAQKTFNFAAHTILHDISATAFYARCEYASERGSQRSALRAFIS
jgi:hypothetical protein